MTGTAAVAEGGDVAAAPVVKAKSSYSGQTRGVNAA